MCWTCIALHGQHQLDLCSFLNSNMDEQPFFFFFLMGCNTMLGSEEYGSSTTLNCQCDISLSSIWTTNVVASKTTFNYINKQHTNHRLHTRPVRCHRYIIKPSSPSISRLTILMMSFYRIYPIKREIKDTTDGDRPPWYLEYTYTVTEGSWKWNITTRETVSIFSLRTIHYMYQLIYIIFHSLWFLLGISWQSVDDKEEATKRRVSKDKFEVITSKCFRSPSWLG